MAATSKRESRLYFRRSRAGWAAAAAMVMCGTQAVAGAPKVTLAPTVILPSANEAVPVGTELTLRPDQVVLSARLGWLTGARLDGPVTIEMDGRPAVIPAGGVLIGAILSGRDAEIFGRDALVFCSGERQEAARGAASPVRVEPAQGDRGPINQRVCLTDQDRDGRFDRALLPGAKRGAGRQPIDIMPVPYRAETGIAMAGESEIRIVYRSGTTFQVQVIEGGAPQKFSILSTRLGPYTIFQNDRNLQVDVKRLPDRTMVGSAVVTVLAVDKELNQARVRIDQQFSLAPYQLGEGARTIHIYVP